MDGFIKPDITIRRFQFDLEEQLKSKYQDDRSSYKIKDGIEEILKK
jgi:ribosomal protein L7Ae-like RNA K-turn-binding protein